jgi:uncharacterized protein YcbK (DUF882 family)
MVDLTLRSRRDVLRLAGGLAAGALVGARGASAATVGATRALSLYAVNTGERLSVEYFRAGAYEPHALDAVNRLFRDHYTDETHVIDAALLDRVYGVTRLLGTRDAVHVVCGYRSASTNAMKHHGHGGAASHSFHLMGRAVDVFLPDRDLSQVRTAALQMGGGVGYYPRSGFVHLDTGPTRAW